MICAFLSRFHLLFPLLKCPKTVFLGLQELCFYLLKDDVLPSKSYAFVPQNLCFWKLKAVFSLFYPYFFARLEMLFVRKREK